MALTIRLVGKRHKIMREESFAKAKLARGAKAWFREHVGGGDCNVGVVAHANGEIVAFVRASAEEGDLYLGGTWVAPAFRGQGLAARLWRKLLTSQGKKRILVTVISDGGKALAEKMQAEFPALRFEIDDFVED